MRHIYIAGSQIREGIKANKAQTVSTEAVCLELLAKLVYGTKQEKIEARNQINRLSSTGAAILRKEQTKCSQ